MSIADPTLMSNTLPRVVCNMGWRLGAVDSALGILIGTPSTLYLCAPHP